MIAASESGKARTGKVLSPVRIVRVRTANFGICKKRVFFLNMRFSSRKRSKKSGEKRRYYEMLPNIDRNWETSVGTGIWQRTVTSWML